VRLAVARGGRGGVGDARAEERFQPHAETLRFLRRHQMPLWAQSGGAQGGRLCLMLSIPFTKTILVTRVFVDGQEGTTGLRINEYLARRSDVEVLRAAPERRKDVAERARLLNAADVAFLCLPDAAAREAAALVSNPSTCLIDASTAHRTAGDWVFGLPELAADQRARIRASKRISNPGCHSTGFILLVRPLVDAGLVSSAALLSASSITGYSGGGRKMIERYEAGGDPLLTAPRPYGLKLHHKHLPEMTVHSRLETAPVFLPIVGNFLKGLSVAVPLHLAMLKRGTTAVHLHAALSERYAGERFVRVMPIDDETTLADGYFDVQACNDTNRVDLFVFASESQALLMCRLDNLGKGASGAAVQSMNVHLGLDEGSGLA
jgi:N-acetyl-gamma-glutamyl-phosphate reductase